MNPNVSIPVLARLAPALAAAGPPALIGAAIGLGLLWLLSRDKEQPKPAPIPEAPPTPALPPVDAPLTAPQPPPPVTAPRAKRVRREDLAEALDYGSRAVTRQEAVVALQALGFGKTAAYKALSPDGRFAEFLKIAPDGLIEWIG